MIEKQKILIVDDRPENLLAMRRVLSRLDVEVVEAISGNEALAATLEQDFAVAILDVQMPGMDGYELAEFLRSDERTRLIPVMFVTASCDEELHVFQGYEVGAVDYIVKPYQPEILLGKVRVFLELDRHRGHLRDLVDEQTEEVRRLNAVLKAIRNINQLIVREREPSKLVQQACGLLTETRGYDRAWIAAVGGDGERQDTVGFSGDNNGFELFARKLAEGWSPPCAKLMRESQRNLVVLSHVEDCAECSLCRQYPGIMAVCCELRYENSVYGMLVVAVNRGIAIDSEEESLLTEVSNDIAFALHRARTEKSLQRSQDILSRTESIAHIGSWDWDVVTDTVTWSDELFHIFQREPAEGAPSFAEYISLYRPEDCERLRAAVETAIEAARPFELELHFVRTDGMPRACLVRGQAEMGREEQVIRLFGSLQDITERQSLENQLRQSQKLESIGTLAGGVAHDFNNLLMGIMNYVELCRSDLDDDHPIHEWLNEITLEAERSANLTRQLLAFARKQTIAPEVLDLNDTVGGMLKLLRRLIGEDIDLAWLPDGALSPVKLDPGQIDQILANLCINARDAIGGVGKVTIETGNAFLDHDYCATHPEVVPGAYVVLAVSDTGCGMETEVLGHVFEPFFTTKEAGQGTGLGLATVYGIVKQNNGHINVYSELGKGTTFRVYLPRFQGADGDVALSEKPSAPVGGIETILFVEDEKSIRVTTEIFLRNLGYNVLVAESPREALEKVAAHSGAIHLLITDVVMPGMSGRDLAGKLGEDYPDMKCLFISGYTANVIAHRGILDEGLNFLAKPFSRDELAVCVRTVIDGRPRSR